MTTMTLYVRKSSSPEFRAALTSIGVLALTTVHHAYGAFVYATPWRLHIAFVAVPGAALIAGLFWFGWARRHELSGRIATGAGVVIAGALSVAMFGIVEGGYNHVLKNILYFGGLNMEAFRTLFPAPAYEIPDSLFFEVTGMGQLVLAAMAGLALVRVVRVRFPNRREMLDA